MECYIGKANLTSLTPPSLHRRTSWSHLSFGELPLYHGSGCLLCKCNFDLHKFLLNFLNILWSTTCNNFFYPCSLDYRELSSENEEERHQESRFKSLPTEKNSSWRDFLLLVFMRDNGRERGQRWIHYPKVEMHNGFGELFSWFSIIMGKRRRKNCVQRKSPKFQQVECYWNGNWLRVINRNFYEQQGSSLGDQNSGYWRMFMRRGFINFKLK